MNDGHAVTTSSPGSRVASERWPITASAPAAVTTFADIDAVALGERIAEMERAAVGIAIQPSCAPLHGLERGRERAPGTFVRSELDDALEPELALQLLLGLSRLVRNQAVEGRAEECHGGPSFRTPGGWSLELLRRQNHSTLPTAARPAAIAPLFGRLEPSTVPGTACFALCFITVFAPIHVSQPRTAYRLLKMDMARRLPTPHILRPWERSPLIQAGEKGERAPNTTRAASGVLARIGICSRRSRFEIAP